MPQDRSRIQELVNKMLITRRSMFTGKIHQVDLPVTQEQIDRYNNGVLLQNAFPDLTSEQREFIKTGVTPEEWKEVFGG